MPADVQNICQTLFQHVHLILYMIGSVFCVHVDPKDSSLAVTGGEDDKAYVWKVADGSQVMECTGMKSVLDEANLCKAFC